eukprot:7752578-Alexandrium_andersonii.AAC.1
MCPGSSRPGTTFRLVPASRRSTCGCRAGASCRRTGRSARARTSPTRRPRRTSPGSSLGTERSSVSPPWGPSVATAASCRTLVFRGCSASA